MPGVKKRIKEVRISSGFTQDEFAAALSIKPSKIRDIEAGRQRVNDDFIAQLTENFNVDLNWLFSNGAKTISELETVSARQLLAKHLPRAPAELLDVDHLAIEKSLHEEAVKVSKDYFHSRVSMTKEFALIPLHEVELAAGVGADNNGETIIDNVAFRLEWLNRIGVSEFNARLARVRGDSMIPTLRDHDLIMIDTSKIIVPVRTRSKGAPSKPDIYALVEDGLARVKRIEHSSEGTLVLHSDNHTLYPFETRTGSDIDEIRIIGKVVWWGHTESS